MLAEEATDELMKLPDARLVPSMAHLSQLFHFDEKIRFFLRERISKSPLESSDLSLDDGLVYMANAGILAAAERDQELAEAIAGAVLALAPSLSEGTTVSRGLQSLLIASAAFEEEGSWSEWLKDRIAGFAARLPAGKASDRLYHQLDELKKVIGLNDGITSRGQAIASAAASFLQ